MVTTPSRMRQLYATADTWTVNDPTLLEGEVGLESDTRRFKVGPGVWSALPYWGGLDDLGAPVDGILYGLKNGTWSPGVDWVEPPQADCNSITPDRAQFTRLGINAANAWDGASENDIVLDLSHPDTANRVQIGFSHSADGEAANVIHSRVLRGSWSGWVTSVGFSEDIFLGDLDTMAGSAAPYSFEVVVASTNPNGWEGMKDNAVVKTVNVGADTAQQMGWQGGTKDSAGLWVRNKAAGVWGEWQLPGGTGSWDDLEDKPDTFPPSPHLHVEADITDLNKYTMQEVDAQQAAQDAALQAHLDDKDNPHETSYDDLLDVPTSFPPGPHTHLEEDVTDLDKYTQAEIDAQQAAQDLALQTHVDDKNNPHNTNWTNLPGVPTEFPPEDHTHVEDDITDLNRVRWRYPYVPLGPYEFNDLVLDGSWTMVCSNPAGTTERAAPQEDGDPQWTLPDLPLWVYNSNASVIESGAEFIVTESITLVGYQVWVPKLSSDINTVIRTFAYPTGKPEEIRYQEIPAPILTEDAWTTIAVSRSLITSGTTFGLRINSLNSGDSTQVGPFDWARDSNSNNNAPATGEWNTANNDSELRINFTDADGSDRQPNLTGVIAGSSISIVNKSDATESVSYTTTSSESTNGNSYEWQVDFDDTGVGGMPPVGAVCVITITVPLPSETQYVSVVDGHAGSPNINGYLAFNGVEQPGMENTAFGVRILYDTWTIPVDWQVVSLIGSSGVGGSSDGSSGVTEFINLIDTPVSYVGNAGYLSVVNQTEDGLEFLELNTETDSLAVKIHNDVGDGTPHGDLNATDFSQPPSYDPDWVQEGVVGTTVYIGPLTSVLFGHRSATEEPAAYTWLGPKNVHVGLGGDYTALASDLIKVSLGDHGALEGLLDDDHPQYFNEERGDDRYISKVEVASQQIISDLEIDKASPTIDLQADTGTDATIRFRTNTTTRGQLYLDDSLEVMRIQSEDAAGDNPRHFYFNNDSQELVNWSVLRKIDADGLYSSTFLGLTDTPAIYTGEAGKVATVNEAEDGLEFTKPSAATVGPTFPADPNEGDLHFLTTLVTGLYVWTLDSNLSSSQWVQANGSGEVELAFLELLDTPETYAGQAGKVATVNAGEDGIEFVDASVDLSEYVSQVATPDQFVVSDLYMNGGTPNLVLDAQDASGIATVRWSQGGFLAGEMRNGDKADLMEIVAYNAGVDGRTFSFNNDTQSLGDSSVLRKIDADGLYLAGDQGPPFLTDILVNDLTVGRGSGDVITNVTLGYQAQDNNDGSGTSATAIGYRALRNAIESDFSVAVGSNAGMNITTGSNHALLGHGAGEGLTTSDFVVAVGFDAMTSATGPQNVAVGSRALRDSAGANNVAIGYEAAETTTTGDNLVAIGSVAAYRNQTGKEFIAIGRNAANAAIDSDGTVAIGYNSLTNMAEGDFNIAIGHDAMRFFVGPGNNNTALGRDAFYDLVSGSQNLGLGYNAQPLDPNGDTQITLKAGAYQWWLGAGTPVDTITASPGSMFLSKDGGEGATLFIKESGSDTTGWATVATTGALDDFVSKTDTVTQPVASSLTIAKDIEVNGLRVGRGGGDDISNTAMGFMALESSTGTGNTGFGYRALWQVTSGLHNMAMGRDTLYDLTTGNYNVAIGYRAQFENVGAHNNIAIGNSALYDNVEGAENLAIGTNALADNLATHNVALGHEAMRRTTTGTLNVALGPDTLFANTTGSRNIALGRLALYANITGDDNVVIGYNSLRYATESGYNTAIGRNTLTQLVGGGYNTALGYGAMDQLTDGSENVAIGYEAQTISPAGSDQITIKAGAYQWWLGAGDPTGSVTASPGSMYLSKDGGAGNTLFVKETGTGTDGWAAVGGGGITTAGPTFPADPDEGSMHYLTVAPIGLFIFYNDGDSAQWVSTSAGGPAGPEGPEGPPGVGAYFEEFHDPEGDGSYRIIGSTLECWGHVGAVSSNGRAYVFPKTFKDIPVVTSNWVGDAAPADDARSDWIGGVTTTGFWTQVRVFDSSTIFSNTGSSKWHAIGEWSGS